MTQGWMFRRIFAVLLFIFTFIAVFICLRSFILNISGVATEGVVVRTCDSKYGNNHSGRRHTHWFDVKYTVNGKDYTQTISAGNGSAKVGEKISVVYDPDHPEDSIGNFGMQYITMAVFGVAIGGYGGVILWRGARVKEGRLIKPNRWRR